MLARQFSDFRDLPELPAFQAQLSLVAGTFPGENFPPIGDGELKETADRLCKGKRSLEEVAQYHLWKRLKADLRTVNDRCLGGKHRSESN